MGLRDQSNHQILFLAIQAGDVNNVKRVEEQLDAGVSPNSVDSLGVSALMLATANGDLPVVNLLLARGADPNATYPKSMGMAPLHIAAADGDVDIIAALITHGANVNIDNAMGDIPLHYVAISGSKEAAQLLIDNGATIGVVNKAGITPFKYAAGDGSVPIMKLLIEHHDPRIDTPIMEPDNLGNTPMHSVAFSEDIKATQFLIDAGADVTAVNEKGETPFHIAALYRNSDYISSLVENGGFNDQKDENGETPFFLAAFFSNGREQDLRALDVLLKAGAKIDAVNESGETALMNATLMFLYHEDKYPYNEDEVDRYSSNIKWLIDHKADVNYQGNYPESMLEKVMYKMEMHGQWDKRLQVASILIEGGANITEESGYSKPLDEFVGLVTSYPKEASKREYDFIKLLLDKGAGAEVGQIESLWVKAQKALGDDETKNPMGAKISALLKEAVAKAGGNTTIPPEPKKGEDKEKGEANDPFGFDHPNDILNNPFFKEEDNSPKKPDTSDGCSIIHRDIFKAILPAVLGISKPLAGIAMTDSHAQSGGHGLTVHSTNIHSTNTERGHTNNAERGRTNC